MERTSTLPEYCVKPRLILGCGNRLLGDDGFGPAVIDRLTEEYETPDDVCVLDVGTGVRNVLFTLCLSDACPRDILLIDAIDRGLTPGELFELLPEMYPPEKASDFFLHEAPTSNLAKELEEKGISVTVLACQPAAIPNIVAPGLSLEAGDAVQRACNRIAASHHCVRYPTVVAIA